MVADDGGAAGSPVSPSIANATAAPISRLSTAGLEIPLAKFLDLGQWKPKVSDFIIWHGWWHRSFP